MHVVVDTEKEALCPITLDSASESAPSTETTTHEANPESEDKEKESVPETEAEKASQDDGELIEIQHSESHGVEEGSSSS